LVLGLQLLLRWKVGLGVQPVVGSGVGVWVAEWV